MGSNIIPNPRKKYPADEARKHEQLMHRHRHNSAHGSVVFALKAMEHIPTLKSATPEAREHANTALAALRLLAEELYDNRIELDGTLVHPKHGQTPEEYEASHRRASHNGARHTDY